MCYHGIIHSWGRRGTPAPFICAFRKEAIPIAKGKYEYWLTPDGLLLLGAWARDGLTLEQIAEKCGCTRETLRQWRNTYPAISAALKKNADIVDTEVENALYKRAVGYTYNEVTRESVKNRETGEESLQVTKVVTKQVIPDTTAQIFWLKNRRPDRWRNRPEGDTEQEDIEATRAEVYGDHGP
ncbi:MAG: helix-turn-helix domain-containing protein [Aristaeellaceae bacterium]